MYDSFEGFQVHNIKISQIFNEFTDSVTTETFDFPEKYMMNISGQKEKLFVKTKIKGRYISIHTVMYPN